MIVRRDESKFEDTLDMLQKKYFNTGGDDECEVIINWSKLEVKEDGVASIFASNSVISNAIKRCRSGIKFVDVHPVGATLYFDASVFRPLHTILKIKK
ncbi:MAG: hypothetical protein F3745_00105 [Nitrospinae bacterium]|nr:hypothetical protein [Nitrospinota bacterium]